MENTRTGAWIRADGLADGLSTFLRTGLGAFTSPRCHSFTYLTTGPEVDPQGGNSRMARGRCDMPRMRSANGWCWDLLEVFRASPGRCSAPVQNCRAAVAEAAWEMRAKWECGRIWKSLASGRHAPIPCHERIRDMFVRWGGMYQAHTGGWEVYEPILNMVVCRMRVKMGMRSQWEITRILSLGLHYSKQ